MSVQAADYHYITSGHINRVSAFEAQKMEADDSRAEGVAELVGDALRKVTANGFVMYGTQAEALACHNRCFTLGRPVADNDNHVAAQGHMLTSAFDASRRWATNAFRPAATGQAAFTAPARILAPGRMLAAA